MKKLWEITFFQWKNYGKSPFLIEKLWKITCFQWKNYGKSPFFHGKTGPIYGPTSSDRRPPGVLGRGGGRGEPRRIHRFRLGAQGARKPAGTLEGPGIRSIYVVCIYIYIYVCVCVFSFYIDINI